MNNQEWLVLICATWAFGFLYMYLKYGPAGGRAVLESTFEFPALVIVGVLLAFNVVTPMSVERKLS